MGCTKVKRLVEEYLDGTLSEPKQIEIHRHLQSCPDCKQYLRERKRLGALLSRSLKDIACHQELSPEKAGSILGATGKTGTRRPRPLILQPRLAVYLLLPLAVLILFWVAFQLKNEYKQRPDSTGEETVSYLKVTTVHYRGTSGDEWAVKRTRIERSNGDKGFLNLEIYRDIKKLKET